MISPGPACCLTIVLDFLSASVKVTLSPKPSFRLSKTPLVGLFPYATWFSLTGAPKSALPAKYNANKSRSDFTASACWLIIWAELTSAAFAVIITFSAFCLICFKTSILNWSFLFADLASSFAISAWILSIFACNSGIAASRIPLYFSASDAVFTAVVSTVVSTVLNPLSPLLGIACPFLGFWFLFTFVASDLILFKMKRLLESCLANALTFACVFVSSFKRSFALLTKFLASSMTDFVFLSSVNWLNLPSTLATKSSNDAVLIATFSVTPFGVSTALACLSVVDSFTEVLFCPSGSLAVADPCPATSLEGSEDFSFTFWGFWTSVGSELVTGSAAWTLPPPRKNNPVATATLAAPKLTLRIL